VIVGLGKLVYAHYVLGIHLYFHMSWKLGSSTPELSLVILGLYILIHSSHVALPGGKRGIATEVPRSISSLTGKQTKKMKMIKLSRSEKPLKR